MFVSHATNTGKSQQIAGQSFCPICESSHLEIYSTDEDKKLAATALGSSRQDVSHGKILRCRACRFGFCQTRPAEKELCSLYRELDSKVYERESRGRFKTAKRHLKIVQHYASGGKLLDVGCASGAFLRCAADAGWDVTGVEPAQVLYSKAKEKLADRGKVICATLQEASLPIACFNAVTLWDVLEHVPDPIEFMKTCGRLLKPGGCLFVNVPDLDSLQARLLRERWPLLLAEHLNYFNRDSLNICAERAQLQWLHFGQRAASFSVEYILYRLAQHRVPTVAFIRKIFGGSALARISVPVFLGEIYGVWKR